jgi:hypothetical protein
MNRDNLTRGWKKLVGTVAIAVLVALTTVANAATPVSFSPLAQVLTNEVAALQAIENPTAQDLQRLRILARAQTLLLDTSSSDGQALKGLVNTLKGPAYASYTPLLEEVANNLLTSLNKNYTFVGSLISEIPNEQDAAAAQAQYNALTTLVNKLNTADKLSKVAAQYDATRRRLNNVFTFISRLLIVPFPGELSRNTIAATVNGVNFRSSAALASDNVFQATVTDDGIVLQVSAVDGTTSSATGRRGLSFSIPLVQSGTFSYAIPAAASLTYRTDVYTETETATAATGGRIFASTQGDEIFGVFSASGPNFELIQGRFRINLTFPQQ